MDWCKGATLKLLEPDPVCLITGPGSKRLRSVSTECFDSKMTKIGIYCKATSKSNVGALQTAGHPQEFIIFSTSEASVYIFGLFNH